MLALALLLSVAWCYYLFVADVQLRTRLDAALVTVPAGFAMVLKAITLFAIFLIPTLLVFNVLSRLGAAFDGPKLSTQQMLEAVREGHRTAQAQSREFMDAQLAKMSDAEAAGMRPIFDEIQRRSAEDAAAREQRYATDPELMQREMRATIAEIRAKARAG
ncbi:hypothetical protein FN976_14740 [Caenimonas sedimenti]|uniref:Uncharacterized protein n=1 Tax=Caenimonas sedimenti TaxID=2596921 RepID=A0A562ZR60_9BURK|nr:hypothetical protein [Caenimonas sedimenti]TWO70798.1 hypothetical protein FN976_14740 [Caenimonas sedimenti]